MANTLPTGIAAHITVIDGQPTTTTQDIATVYGKQHAKVLAIVRQRMSECPDEWRLANFGETVTERENPSGGAPIQSPVIRMTKKGFHFVVGKFTGAKAVAHQIAFADEFERMEQTLQTRTPRKSARQSITIDVRGLLLSGQSEPQPLPPELLRAINDRAWEIMRELHPLLHEHMQRRIAFTSINGHNHIDLEKAIKAVQGTTLGNALTHMHHTSLNGVIRMLDIAGMMAQEAHERATAALSGAKGAGR